MRFRRPSAVALAFVALALILWFGATLVLLGDTGKFSDDYIAHLISPLTGEVDLARHPWTRWPYFWRPLHLIHVYAVNTLSFDRPWIGHLELALVHLGVCFLLYRTLVRFGAGRTIAVCASSLFMVCPLHAEAVLWTSASCNAISCLFLLWALRAARASAAAPPRTSHAALMFALAFVTACWYEPAAGALLAIPIAAACGVPAGLHRRDGLRRQAILTLAALAACALYVSLLLNSAPGGARGQASSLVSPGRLPTRIADLAGEVADAVVGERARQIVLGALEAAQPLLVTPTGMIWTMLACGLVVTLCVLAVRSRGQPIVRAPVPTSPLWRVAALGLCVSVGALVPIALTVSPEIDLRSLYVPLLGATITLAAACEAAARRVRQRWRWPVTCASSLCVAAIAILGAIACMGFQAAFRNQSRIDSEIVARLVEHVPNPAPGTVFVPLIIDAKPAATGHAGFDAVFRGAFELPSTITPVLRHAYRRTDISGVALTYRLGGDVPIHGLTQRGFELRRVRGGAFDDPVRVEWTHVVPCVVDRDLVLRPVSELRIVPLEGEPFRITTSFAPGVSVELQELPGRATRARRSP